MDVAAQSFVEGVNRLLTFQGQPPLKSDQHDPPKRIASRLVTEGCLTKLQAKAALGGRVDALFFGDYLLLDQLGRGGMGHVYSAWHRHMDRRVALKVLARRHAGNRELAERFKREIRLVAQLSHPHIVAAYDAGEQQGRLYFVMELVNGKDLQSTVDHAGPLPIPTAVRYVMQVAQGLAFAHDQGIVHRDVKPANLLVDQTGIVKILDLGLARYHYCSAPDQDRQRAITETGQLLGTVDYMAPEQGESAEQADHRCDIYSLGCSLYFLLTGQPLYAGSSLVDRMIAHRSASIPSLCRARAGVSQELNQTFLRMVAKSPDQRFSFTSDLAMELSRHLDAYRDEQSLALTIDEVAPFVPPAVNQVDRETTTRTHPAESTDAAPSLKLGSRFQTGRSWSPLRRHTLVVAAVVILALSLIVGAVLVNPGMLRRQTTTKASSSDSSTSRGSNGKREQSAGYGKGDVVDGRAIQNSQGAPKTNLVPAVMTRLTGHSAGIEALRYLPDGISLASGSGDGTVRLWNVPRQQCVWSRAAHDKAVLAIAPSPQASALVTAGDDRVIVLRELTTGSERRRLKGHKASVLSLAISHDGSYLVSGSADQTVRLWSMRSDQPPLEIARHEDWVDAVAISSEGMIASGGGDEQVLLYDLNADRDALVIGHHDKGIEDLAFSPNGRLLASAGKNGSVRLWDVDDRSLMGELEGHSGPVWSAVFGPAGEMLATAGKDGSVRIWDVDERRSLAVFFDHDGEVNCVAFSPDASHLASGGDDATIVIRNVRELPSREF